MFALWRRQAGDAILLTADKGGVELSRQKPPIIMSADGSFESLEAILRLVLLT